MPRTATSTPRTDPNPRKEKLRTNLPGKPEPIQQAHGDSHKEASPIWKYASGVLLLLLIASFFTKLRPVSSGEEEKSASNTNPKGH